jgi:hypothetical protein
MLIDISEYLLDGGRAVVALGGDDVLERLVRFHAEFAVHDRTLITVHFRDLVHAVETDQQRVRQLQSRYALLWAEQLRHRQPELDARTAQAAAHATFGLINSTPFSSRLAAADMVELLSVMALEALAAVTLGAAHKSTITS